jgi:hypothetical protein
MCGNRRAHVKPAPKVVAADDPRRLMKEGEALSRVEKRMIPVEWGSSALTQFYGQLDANLLATFVRCREFVAVIEGFDSDIVEGASTYFHGIDSERQISAKLFMRAFALYRSATRHAMSGQLYETHVLLRSMLEAAVYAWICAVDAERRQKWDQRHTSSAGRSAARNAFAWGGLLSKLEKIDKSVANRIRLQYEEVIDFGAHPNKQGIDLSIDAVRLPDGNTNLLTIYAHATLPAIMIGLLDVLNAVRSIFDLLMLTVGDRLRLVDLDRRVDVHRRRFLRAIEEHKAAEARQDASRE